MDFFNKLSPLIRAQGTSSSDSVCAAKTLAKFGSPSTSIAILDNGSISAQCFSTVGDRPETVFQACSISKPIAGLAVLRLVAQGKLDLDVPVTEYLSSDAIEMISTPPTRKFLECVTLKHLMSHTSGLNQHGFPGYIRNPVDLPGVLTGKPPCNTFPVHLDSFPGQTFSYSGGGMSVMQLIVETVTGRSFPEVMSELVFEPLGMKRSFYKAPTKEDNHAAAYHNGYVPCEVPFHVFAELAAAGLWTTPTDLLKAVRAVQESLVATADNSLPFLPQTLTKRMLTEIQSGMALSWFASKDPGTAFGHAGSNNPGWRCFVLGYADLSGSQPSLDKKLQGSGLCIMTNSEAGDRLWIKLAHAITYLQNWPTPPTSLLLHPYSIPFVAPEKAIDLKWSEWKGEWEKGKWRIDKEDGEVCVFFEKMPPVRLRAVAMSEGEENSVRLLPEGFEIMVCLTEERGNKVVQVWREGTFKDVLRRRMTIDDVW